MMYLGKNPIGLIIERGSFDTPIVIPQEYTRLAYLEATGTQCIDTGINLKLSSEIELDGCITSAYGGTWPRLCGTGTPTLFFACVGQGEYGNKLVFVKSYYQFGNSSEKSVDIIPYARTKYIINKDQYQINIKDILSTTLNIGATSVTENNLSTITLFCGNNKGTYTNFTGGYIYEYKYSENNVVLRHMFPVKRNSDDELGMYDIINNVFYTNAGTGTFIAGEVLT